MSAVPGPRPAPPGATATGPEKATEHVAAVEAAVQAFESIDPADLTATRAAGETLSQTLIRALDDDSRHDTSR